jgi:hypothetical protein
MPDWKVFYGTGTPPAAAPKLPEAPSWRRFSGTPRSDEPPPHEDYDAVRKLGAQVVSFSSDSDEVLMVNAAIHLRRALLITGSPGVGKSSLAHIVARELGLGAVLRWPVMTLSGGSIHPKWAGGAAQMHHIGLSSRGFGREQQVAEISRTHYNRARRSRLTSTSVVSYSWDRLARHFFLRAVQG